MEIKELLKHLHSYDDMVNENEDLSYPKSSVQALMEKVEEKKTVYMVIQESNVDGEIIINAVPCATLEIARKVLKEEVSTILKESHHYSGYTEKELEEEFEIEKSDDSYYINDPADDYYEDIKIVEKELVTE